MPRAALASVAFLSCLLCVVAVVDAFPSPQAFVNTPEPAGPDEADGILDLTHAEPLRQTLDVGTLHEAGWEPLGDVPFDNTQAVPLDHAGKPMR
jgi:hypothetical protein